MAYSTDKNGREEYLFERRGTVFLHVDGIKHAQIVKLR
jgi:hypothetical protein